uniref:Uncharacterized protein n=1 Tax=Chromera velia CCMP2878 TaxID=1169474 RepID=A0A0G4FTI8_9ALVE|eukprot:Cvel_18716.t1-p1 / transcript=Cvel_18716.t1 / gene=Cvel_18716 / organism=Chromera_velia_CCMP2878 / gene_product=hypothetical protein / transcript_product=hypothetical protein / location=Cvel_scaffold1568:38401-38631(+) / protein_length=77 / sequence_SO=supercontig / SO=protein_coding / is_pseudo=false
MSKTSLQRESEGLHGAGLGGSTGVGGSPVKGEEPDKGKGSKWGEAKLDRRESSEGRIGRQRGRGKVRWGLTAGKGRE